MYFKEKSGISIEIIKQKVKKELKLNNPKIKKNKRVSEELDKFL